MQAGIRELRIRQYEDEARLGHKTSLDSQADEIPTIPHHGKDPYYCDKTYFDITYPCIGVKFVLQRDNSQSLIQIYVPTALIVILSWVSFWIDCTSVPGRVSLALLTVLTMTTQSAGAVANLPAVSYIKAIDVWLSVCLTFVFLGLIEFAYVNVQSRVDYRRRQCKSVDRLIKSPGSSRLTDLSTITINGRQQLHGEGIDENMCNNGHENHAEQSCWPCFKHLARLERARAIDKASRVIFPAAFIVFNVIYWTYVFYWTPGFMEGWD
ncbi:glycine receptor subunit alpha-1-like [Dreissena polymorpha]|uniref:glycine receptor subunit alpha-1-like n=1 Tax=Dreissena polymorpha TaxID=45954 RepID=UPI0022648FF5|nr:glycine receptor subunit alpha-1-like [Dreissena polymorpha]